MTLAEESAALSRAVRAAAEGTGWRVSGGTLSRIEGENTFHASIFSNAMNFYAKPVIWDFVFWRILGSEVKRRPSATRHWSRFSCNVPIRGQGQVASGPPEAVARGLLEFADTEFRRTDHFDHVPEARFFPDRDEDFQTARVLALLAREKIGASRCLAGDVVAGRVLSMYTHSTPAGSFFALALSRIDAGDFGRSD